MPKKPPSEHAGGEAARLNVDYIKSNYFRTIAPSGLIGSITPQGFIQIALFSERQAIPQRLVHALEADGRIGKIIERIGRDAIVREVEVAVTIDADTARTFAKHIEDLVKELETIDKPESNE